MANLTKKLVRKILLTGGYEVARYDRLGRNQWKDIQRIFDGTPLTVIFDVGANEGQTSVELAAAFPEATIHGFEPSASVFDNFQRLVAQSGRIRPVNTALGEVVGEEILYLNRASVTNSLLRNDPHADRFQPHGWAANVGAASVQISTLDVYCAKQGIEFIDLLKIDTQGYDLKVLEGSKSMLQRRAIAVIFVEVLFVPLYEGQAYFQEIYEHLWARGFRLVSLYNVQPNDRKFISWCDALFIQPDGLDSRLLKRRGPSK